MAKPSLPIPPPEYPPELVQAVAQEAARDADRVGVFLDTLGLRPAGDGTSPQPPLYLPPWFLLELAAALRLWTWERHGIFIHRDAGLPPAMDALRAVFQRLTAAGSRASGEDTPWNVHVLELFIEHFAWSGRHDLDADLLLGEADEDELVDVLANLIWTHRAAARRERRDLGRGNS